ncbi:hypothetical protein APHAL10511_007595 [Amanita phalloides]|nr:hypothetical protein APHAL10511_007595 [Amanita phalloides]
MESLNSLASSLPTAHQKAEQELLNNFKSAALSITTLYRSSRETSKRAYDAGYAAACQDLLNMIQHGVSAGGIDHGSSREGMTIGRVMDWTEARLEALKQKDDEEEEEEDREKDRKPATTTAAPASSSAPPAPPAPKPAKSSPRPKEVKPASPASFSPMPILPDPPSTATSSPSSTPPTFSAPLPLRAAQRPTKPRPSTKGDGSAPYGNLPPAHAFDFFADPRPSALTAMPVSVPGQNGVVAAAAEALSAGAGAKRRHAMMMMLDAASPATAATDHHPLNHLNHLNHLHHAHHHHHLHHHSLALAAAGGGGVPSTPGAGRRRERRSRVNTQQSQAINLLSADVMMDVEEENGRERKRVARR